MKEATEYNKLEILAWVGVGPKKEGLWKLTEEQVTLFEHREGVVHKGFRHTRWNINDSGVIRWEEAGKRWIREHPDLEQLTF